MKRLLLALPLLGLIRTAEAGLITHTDYTAGNVITAAGQNTNENAIVNEFNGNINNANILDGGIATADLADGLLTNAKLSSAFAPTISSMTLTTIFVTTATVTSLLGSTSNDTANVGVVGESTTTFGSAVSIASGVYSDITSVTLTAGDWDVSGNVYANIGSATWSLVRTAISINSGNNGTGLTLGDNVFQNQFTNSAVTPVDVSMSIATIRFSLSSTTSLYLKGLITASAGNALMSGRIEARRRR